MHIIKESISQTEGFAAINLLIAAEISGYTTDEAKAYMQDNSLLQPTRTKFITDYVEFGLIAHELNSQRYTKTIRALKAFLNEDAPKVLNIPPHPLTEMDGVQGI